MRREGFLAAIELALAIGVALAFLVLLTPAAFRMLSELIWALGTPRSLPAFGLHPHWVAEARYAPSLVLLAGCAALAVCYRWLTARRRG